MRTLLSLSLITAAALTGCATNRVEAPSTGDSLGRYVFDYTVTNAKSAHLVQAFDDGSKTYLQFNQFQSLRPVIRTDAGAELPYDRSGPYAVISGVHPRLVVAVAAATATVVNNQAPGASALAAPTTSTPAQDIERARLAELTETKAELARVKAELEKARAQLASERKAVTRAADAPYVVRFADNSTSAEISGPTLDELTALAAKVKRITVTGYTDAGTVTAASSQLALKRALAVRKLLQERGIPPSKIQVRYFGAGRYVADNTTEDGRAANRRVEIQLTTQEAAG